MAIIQCSGPVKSTSLPKTASTALAANSLVKLTSGRLVAATSSDLVLAGVLPAAVAATDSDYADTNSKLVIQLQPDSEFEMLCTGASASATTHVGNAYDLSDAVTLNLAGTSYKQFVVTKVIDTTHVRVRPNMAVLTVV